MEKNRGEIYRDAAIRAATRLASAAFGELTELDQRKACVSAWKDACVWVWEQAGGLKELLPGFRDKSCPRDAFIALCERGYVKAITLRSSASLGTIVKRESEAQQFATNGADALLKGECSGESQESVDAFVNRLGKRFATKWRNHNNVMDVVWALWNASLLHLPQEEAATSNPTRP